MNLRSVLAYGFMAMGLVLASPGAKSAVAEFPFGPDADFKCSGAWKESGKTVSFEVNVKDGVMEYHGPHDLKSQTGFSTPGRLSMLVERRTLSKREIVAGFSSAYSIDWKNGERDSFATLGLATDGAKEDGIRFMLVEMSTNIRGGGQLSVTKVVCALN